MDADEPFRFVAQCPVAYGLHLQDPPLHRTHVIQENSEGFLIGEAFQCSSGISCCGAGGLTFSDVWTYLDFPLKSAQFDEIEGIVAIMSGKKNRNSGRESNEASQAKQPKHTAYISRGQWVLLGASRCHRGRATPQLSQILSQICRGFGCKWTVQAAMCLWHHATTAPESRVRLCTVAGNRRIEGGNEKKAKMGKKLETLA